MAVAGACSYMEPPPQLGATAHSLNLIDPLQGFLPTAQLWHQIHFSYKVTAWSEVEGLTKDTESAFPPLMHCFSSDSLLAARDCTTETTRIIR